MKKILVIFLTFFAVFSCIKEVPVDFGIDCSEVTLSAEGGEQVVRVTASGYWASSTDNPWISISPLNGRGSTDCVVKIDTTLLSGGVRSGVVSFFSGAESRLLRVYQTGYENIISPQETSFEVPDYADFGKREIKVKVTANVEFDVVVDQGHYDDGTGTPSAIWVTVENPSIELDRGARPRTVELTIAWQTNTRPFAREATVSFAPKNPQTIDSEALPVIKIKQGKAPEIEDNRQGDSLAIVGCARSFNMNLDQFAGEKLDNWSFVELWEPRDEGFTPDKKGRVKKVQFSMLSTKDELPYELQFLRKVETLSIFSNANSFLRSFTSGPYLAALTQLRNLQIFGYGLVRLDDDFAALSNLEELDLSGNNFNEYPSVLTAENFPNLKSLNLSACRRATLFNLETTTTEREMWGGFNEGAFPIEVLGFQNMEYLSLSNNYICGTLPTEEEILAAFPSMPLWSEEDIIASADTLRSARPEVYSLVGRPKILPNCKWRFSINLNLLVGEIPQWILFHPYLMEWVPDILVFNQDSFVGLTREGAKAGFKNVPQTPDYYYEVYPLKKPSDYEEDF